MMYQVRHEGLQNPGGGREGRGGDEGVREGVREGGGEGWKMRKM